MLNDEIRLDWLEQHQGCNLISDDMGRWAVSTTGFQNLPENQDEPFDAQVVSLILKTEWKNSIREAIDYFMKTQGE
jgi:hypothetical protein